MPTRNSVEANRGHGHIMVHDYFKVDWDIVYTTAKEHVRELKQPI
jgi:uncharacterized protein with HEPN domain